MPKVVGYFCVVASMKALSRRQKDRKLMRHPGVRELIIERIKDGWGPEQIAGRLIYEKAPVRVCHALPDRVLRSNVPRRRRFTALYILLKG